ncbi:hypothetical protein [Flavobacterium sp.]|uniref:hypothetical protein n=1 Tax=Flavobacterium sp. TaxID=239 RepID=UPI0026114DBD|nr:hypothetical protein [Flavobacterium sp.]
MTPNNPYPNAPFTIEDDILVLSEGNRIQLFPLQSIYSMHLSHRKALPFSGMIGRALQYYITSSYRLHILNKDGTRASITIKTEEREAYKELISWFRHKEFA